MTQGDREEPSPLAVRHAADYDSAGLISLIGGCFAEYPGCVLDLPGIDAWMLAPASAYNAGGRLWVVEAYVYPKRNAEKGTSARSALNHDRNAASVRSACSTSAKVAGRASE